MTDSQIKSSCNFPDLQTRLSDLESVKYQIFVAQLANLEKEHSNKNLILMSMRKMVEIRKKHMDGQAASLPINNPSSSLNLGKRPLEEDHESGPSNKWPKP